MGAESAREELRQTAVVEPSLDMEPRFPLGEVLRSGVGVPAAAITTALESKGGARLGEHLVRGGVVSEDVVAWAVAQQYGLPFIDLTKEAPQPEAVAMVTTDAARALQILPIRIRPNGTLDVVVGDPTDALLHRVLGALPVRRVRVGMAPPSQLKPTIDRTFPRRASPPVAVPDHDRRVRRVFEEILRQAATDRASDVHLEPVDDHVRVRFRVDGVLRESLILLGDVARPLLTYIKQSADLNDLRVSTVPTVGGEHCVLHLRDRPRDRLALDDLGMTPGVRALYTELARSSSGMIVVSGPARSGKTTTMFATLDVVGQDQLSVMTVEDSIDVMAPGINQFCIDTAAGETFASGLVTIAGQDPDVLLVGELPDLVSARHALRLATTGHFVVTSVHAMDAVDALWRLLDFGLEPREIASTVVAFESQRLLRRVCPNCVRAYTPSPRDIAFYTRRGGNASDTFVRGAGCGRCGLTGYQGRAGIFEVLPMTDAVTYELLRGADPARVREIACAEGMHTLAQHALQLVSTQVTTIDEMRRTL